MKPHRSLLLLINFFTLSLLPMAAKRSRSTQQHPITPHGHFIKTSECHVPHYPKQAKKIKKSEIYRMCAKDENLISARFDESLQQYVLHINDSVAQLTLRAMEQESKVVGYKCSFREIQRVGSSSDGPVVLGKEVPFWDGYTVPRNVEGLKAVCRNGLAEDLQADTFAFVQPRRTFPLLISWHRRPSIIMIGMDSVSRIGLRSNMPKLTDHLKIQGWFELEGYTSVGKSALDNLMAILTGHSPVTWTNLRCDSRGVGCIKSLPLIWKRFKRRGYMTAYGEGMADFSMFDQDASGFFEQPLDYYARPIPKPREQLDCIDRRLNIRYIFDFCEQYLQRHANSSQPLFGVLYGNSVSHDEPDADAIMEPVLLEHLQRLQKFGVLSQSIVILFSDKGPGRRRNRDPLEESLPLLFISLPPWFRVHHPELVQGLRINGKRLASAYDLHLTLQHLLELGERWPHPVDQLLDCPSCQTLLAPLPENRTCSDAGIGEPHCPCDTYKQLTMPQIQQLSLGKLLVSGINDFLHHRNLQQLCSNLTLKSVTKVLQRVDRRIANGTTYRVVFSAKPNNPKFSATTRYNHRRNLLEYQNVDSIGRLNSYRRDSDCLSRLTGRKFCICRNRII